MQPQNPSQYNTPGSYNQLVELDKQVRTYFLSEPGIPKGKEKCNTLEIITRNKNSSHLLSVYLVLVPVLSTLYVLIHIFLHHNNPMRLILLLAPFFILKT